MWSRLYPLIAQENMLCTGMSADNAANMRMLSAALLCMCKARTQPRPKT